MIIRDQVVISFGLIIKGKEKTVPIFYGKDKRDKSS